MAMSNSKNKQTEIDVKSLGWKENKTNEILQLV